jgi:Zn-dependent peptidase ImmA (M78 family)
MAFDLQAMGSKLRRYRSQVKASLNEVSSATGIPESLLEDYEQGRSQPTGDEILIIADYYKCDFKFFISNEKLAAFEQTETLFRKYSDELSKADRWAILELLFLCECEEFLLKELPSIHRKNFIFKKIGTYYKTHGAEAASALRNFLGYAPNAVAMDIYRDFRSIGCHIFRRRLTNSNISGLFVRHPIAGKCILVNYSEDVYRQRFTAAHEVAHAILDDDQDVIVSFTGDKRNLSEIRANVFASQYLMPPDLLKMIPSPEKWDQQKAVEWASKLKVSTQSLGYALKDAGLISEKQEEEIIKAKVSAEMKNDPEFPMTLSPKMRQRREEFLIRGLSMFYVGLCFDAFDRGEISAGRLGEMLLTKEDELPALAEIYGRQIKHED